MKIYRTHFEEYGCNYAEHMIMRFEDGILELRFHSDGGPLRWGLEAHRAILPAIADISNDPDVECVIVTGTGNAFLGEFNDESWTRHGFKGSFGMYQGYDIFWDQTRMPLALLGLKVPVIGAINGPSIVHNEIALLHDIVICSENTEFSDVHWQGLGIVPGDGIHTLFRELLGPNRARYYLMTGTKIGAAEALQLGMVGEVLPQDQLLPRAWEIARTIYMTRDRIQRRLTRSLLIQPWLELFTKELKVGIAHEALGCFSHWQMEERSE
jgi:enoyl-CoA hydratase/carnithine racemase